MAVQMKMWRLLLMMMLMMVLMMVLMQPACSQSASQPTVTVGQTTVYGTSVQVGEVTVSQFLGLRFGQPPVELLRFSKPSMAPLSAAAAAAGARGGGDDAGRVVNATSFPRSCPGLLHILPLDEDCLFLNIYLPQSSSSPEGGDGGEGKNALPVMVWLYGGGFVFGSGAQYDGSLLAAEGNVMVVTLNYRVGPLGFLSTGDNSSLGNYGLWDQWLALKWVQTYIGHFGGDVNRVTLFGESAGAASVSYHVTSPHSQGLFHRAILHSGSRLNPWALDTDAVSHAQTLARMVSCDHTDSSSALVACLRGQSWRSLRPVPLLSHTWGPVVDRDFILPFNASSSGIFQGPLIVGVNNREGGMLLGVHKKTRYGLQDRKTHLTYVQKTLQQLYPAVWAAATPSEKTLTARVVDCVYRGQGSTDSHVTDEELEAFVGDVEVALGSQQFVDAMLPVSEALYQYYFDHFPDNVEGGQKGMDHAMEISYTFGFHRGLRARYSPFYNVSVSDRDQLLARRFRTLLTNFAHSGNPNQPTSIPAWPEWPRYTKGDQSYASLTFTSRVASRLKGQLMRVWRETVPALLRGQGPHGLNLTDWARCSNPGDLHSSSPSVVAASDSAVLFLLLLLLCLSGVGNGVGGL